MFVIPVLAVQAKKSALLAMLLRDFIKIKNNAPLG